MSVKTDLLIVGGVALALFGVAWWAKNKIADVGGAIVDVAGAAVPYVNPVDSRNLAYTGVNAVGTAVTGDSGFSLGTAIFNATHKDEVTGKWWWE
jgi:hypothetical protein